MYIPSHIKALSIELWRDDPFLDNMLVLLTTVTGDKTTATVTVPLTNPGYASDAKYYIKIFLQADQNINSISSQLTLDRKLQCHSTKHDLIGGGLQQRYSRPFWFFLLCVNFWS